MVQLTEKAVGKVKEIMASQDPQPTGLRIAVVGGGCSGFSYTLGFDDQISEVDQLNEIEGVRVVCDPKS